MKLRKRERGESEGLMIGSSGGMVWPAVVEAWGKGREVRVTANEEKWEWDEVRAETRRESGESESESRDKEREKIIKILNAHATVTVHI